MSIITLTTDFGTSDHYVAQMKGVILGINPQATIVNISHAIAPQNILQGAGVIGEAHRSFPTWIQFMWSWWTPAWALRRRPILLSTPNAHFLGPDNGVLSHILSEGIQRASSDLAPALGRRDSGPPHQLQVEFQLDNPRILAQATSASPSMAGTSLRQWPPICPWEFLPCKLRRRADPPGLPASPVALRGRRLPGGSGHLHRPLRQPRH